MLEMSKNRHSPCVLDSGPAVWEGARCIPSLVHVLPKRAQHVAFVELLVCLNTEKEGERLSGARPRRVL